MPQKEALSYTFATLAILFFVIASSLVLTLRKQIPKLYEEYCGVFWLATIILSLPLTFRAIFDALISKNEKFENYFFKTYKRATSYSISFFFLTTYIPIASQITSLVFGFVRRHKAQSFETQRKNSKDYSNIRYGLQDSVTSESVFSSAGPN